MKLIKEEWNAAYASHVWYAVAFAADVTERPFARTVAGELVALRRGPSGAVLATVGSCSPRRTAERHGFVWLWHGPPAAADAARIPALPDCAGRMRYRHAPQDHLAEVEGMLGPAPVVEVHPDRVVVRRSSIAAGVRRTEDCTFWPPGYVHVDTVVRAGDSATRTLTRALFTPETDSTSHTFAGIFPEEEP